MICPVVPAGIATVMSRIAPARRTVARYVTVVVPFEAAVAVMATSAPAASADRTTSTTTVAATASATNEARSLRTMIPPQIGAMNPPWEVTA
ncbi:hypothetical protein [Kribbella sp. NPDC051620]|uniref:hypothetical protein n=1 Tax=Kribbella sp. NPDC051620 TaxID=3364120 RepID=UPI0037AD7C84